MQDICYVTPSHPRHTNTELTPNQIIIIDKILATLGDVIFLTVYYRSGVGFDVEFFNVIDVFWALRIYVIMA